MAPTRFLDRQVRGNSIYKHWVVLNDSKYNCIYRIITDCIQITNSHSHLYLPYGNRFALSLKILIQNLSNITNAKTPYQLYYHHSLYFLAHHFTHEHFVGCYIYIRYACIRCSKSFQPFYAIKFFKGERLETLIKQCNPPKISDNI